MNKDNILDMPNHLTDEDRKTVWELMNKFNWNMYNKLMVGSAGLYGVDCEAMTVADGIYKNSEARYMYWYAISDVMKEKPHRIARLTNFDSSIVTYGIHKFGELLKTDSAARERYKVLMEIVEYGYK